jgi:hypothetical protein
MMRVRTTVALALAFVLISLPACEPPEAQHVRDAWQEFTDALNSGDGKTATGLLTQRIFDQYDAWLDVARRGSRDQVKALDAAARAEIVKMRHRLPGQLAGLDGKKYLTLAIDKGWYAADPADRPPKFGKITFTDDRADVELLIRDEPSGRFHSFVLVNGLWKIDRPPIDEFYNERIAQAVKSEHSTEDNLIMRWESGATGVMVKPSIWDPPR